jgi:hypothetical protein
MQNATLSSYYFTVGLEVKKQVTVKILTSGGKQFIGQIATVISTDDVVKEITLRKQGKTGFAITIDASHIIAIEVIKLQQK